MKKPGIIILLFVFLVLNSKTYGQQLPDSVKIYRIETRDGNIFNGAIISEDDINIVLRAERLGEIKIPKAEIRIKTEIQNFKIVDGKVWDPNPQSARYFWAPNGYGLKDKESYYQNIWVLYNQISVGVSNNFSVGAGMLPLFLFGGPTPIFIIPKFSFPIVKDKFNVGTGALLGSVLGSEGGGGVYGLLFGTATVGSRDNNFSIGLADGFSDGSWMKFPLINVSGMVRIGPKGYLVTENYLISLGGESIGIISLGGRTVFHNLSLDYSLWVPVAGEMDQLVAIPVLGITIPMGNTSKGK